MGLLWELAESQMFCRDTTLLLTDNQTAGQQQLYCIIMLTYFAQFLKLRSHLQSFSQILQAKSSHSNGNPMQISLIFKLITQILQPCFMHRYSIINNRQCIFLATTICWNLANVMADTLLTKDMTLKVMVGTRHNQPTWKWQFFNEQLFLFTILYYCFK